MRSRLLGAWSLLSAFLLSLLVALSAAPAEAKPLGSRMDPFRDVRSHNPAAMTELNKANADLRQVAVARRDGWLVVTCRISTDAFLMEEDYAACCCAVQNLMLALWSEGIATKWSTGDLTRHPRFAELAGFDPAQERVVGLIWYGRPVTLPTQTRRPVADVVRQRP